MADPGTALDLKPNRRQPERNSMNSMRCRPAFIVALTLAILTTTIFGTARAADLSEAELAEMLYRNCVPNGYDRSPELYLVYYPDVLTSSGPDTGFACSHGFPWEDDTRVPLIFFGRGIRKGVVQTAPASLEDITPTLARLVGVHPPETSNGRALTESLLRPWQRISAHGRHRRRPAAPRAAVVFTLDQCRADYLTNPDICPAFEFTRSVLMRRGASYAEARLSYAGSRTAVSHAVIGTGATPGVNGIIGNNIRIGDAFPLAFNDNPRHSMEMFNLLCPTLADAMDLSLGNRPIVISMSPYGRAALGMAGHGAAYQPESDKDVVLKLARDTGLPYTNREFFDLPSGLIWSDNNPIRIDQWLAANYGVDLHSDPWTQNTVIVDRSPYAPRRRNKITGPQGLFPDGTPFAFSHAAVTPGQEPPASTVQLWDPAVGYPGNSYFEDTMYTPYYTLWATDMLLLAMDREGVGRDGVADLVYYNFKCLDKLGHRYGVNSPELYTYLYTVDYCLRKIKCFLDRRIGPDGYVMVVTADHGAHNAYDDRILYNRDLFDAIENEFGTDVILNDPDQGAPFDDMIYLDRDLLDTRGKTPSDVALFVEHAFPDYVYRAFAIDTIFANIPSTAPPGRQSRP
jgi:predicted AlkP superfamily pyrophosphatase or phosphodiesterase